MSHTLDDTGLVYERVITYPRGHPVMPEGGRKIETQKVGDEMVMRTEPLQIPGDAG